MRVPNRSNLRPKQLETKDCHDDKHGDDQRVLDQVLPFLFAKTCS